MLSARFSRSAKGHRRQFLRTFSSIVLPENEVYLHETRIPTYHFQDSLPKLAIPELEESLKKYEYSSKPMVTEEEHENTKKIIAGFLKNEGPALQNELIELDKKEYSSFYNKMWFDMYLTSRDPLPLNFNPQVTWNDEKDVSKNEQGIRATNLIVSALKFYKTLLDEKLMPDVFHTQTVNTSVYENVCRMLPRQVSFYGSYLFGAYPLDMSQYNNLFSSTRIPQKDKDEIRKFKPSESKHIVVQRGSSFFKVPVLNDDMSTIAPETLERGLRAILAEKVDHSDPVGVLTTMNRDDWAAARAKLEKSTVSKATLETIDSALFAVCLEEEKPEEYAAISSCMLHGNARNRWFDKSFELIVTGNGKASVNFEHAWGDGVAVLRFFNEVYTDTTKNVAARQPVTDGLPTVSKAPSSSELGVPELLQFELDGDMKATIVKAGKDVDAVMNSIEVGTVETDVISKQILKEKKVGADGFMQMGFQLAHQRLKGFTPATYESASTAAFKHGRTETIRSATPEAAAFARSFDDDSVSKEMKAELLRKAIKNHGSITKDALMGKGFDRHLFALRVLAEQRGNGLPELYEDKTYKTLNHIILSTSTLSSEALFAGGFGPVNKDCFALAYGIGDEEGARTAVTTYKLGSQEFAETLEKSFSDMKDVL